MAQSRIPDRSDEPALQQSLDRGPQSRTAAHSEDVARDAGKGPQDDARSQNGPDSSKQKPRAEDSRDTAEPDEEEVETMTGVPPTSKELSQM